MTKNKGKDKKKKRDKKPVGGKTKTGPIKSFFSFFKKYFREFEIIAILIAVISFVFTAWFSRLQYNEWLLERVARTEEKTARKEERDARKAEGIANAQLIIQISSLGNSGKVGALEYLASEGIILDGIDLSCKTHGSEWDDDKKECLSGRVYLQKLNLGKEKHKRPINIRAAIFSGADLELARFDRAHLEYANFEGSNLKYGILNGAILWNASFDDASLPDAKFDDADLFSARFDGAYLFRTKFDGAYLWGASFDGANLREARFDGAILWNASFDDAYLYNSKFDDAYLYKAKFEDAKNLTSSQISTGWVWADTADIHLPSIPKEWKQKSAREIILFCDPDIRDIYDDEVNSGKRKRGLPDPEKCKYWKDWDEEKRKSWLDGTK